jgi:GWxTD domain-containing protein
MPTAPRSWILVGLLAASAGPLCPRLAAQAPAERAQLDSLGVAFSGIADSTTLLRMERTRIAYARQHRDDPMVHLGLGLLAYRLGEVTPGTKHYDDAAGEFEWASDLRPHWPYPWYWLGRAELAIGEAKFIPLENLKEWLGLDALSKGARAFAQAVAVDPSFSRALVDLANTALRQRIAPRLHVALHALRLAAATPAGHDPAVLLARGRVELELDNRDSALVAFRDYLAAGGDSGVGGVELARVLALLDRPDSAVAAYYAAVRAASTPAARAAFRRDLVWIATPEELAAFDRLPEDSLAPWLRRFWHERDVEDARLPGARLVEQFRRYAYARAHFALISRHRYYGITDVFRDTTQQEFDDRGVIYMRHGAPDARVGYSDPNVEPNETWVYRRPPPQHDLVLHFVATGHVQDYRLVESLLDAYGFSTAVKLQTQTDIPTSVVNGLIDSRAQIDPIYQRLEEQGTAGRGPLLAEERAQGRRAIRVGTTTDDYALRFDHDLDPVLSSFVLADSAFAPVLHVVFALPGPDLRAFSAPGGVGYPLEFRLIVYDSTYRQVAGLDTLRVFRNPGPVPRGSFLTEQLAVRVPPGRYHYHFVVRELQVDAGALVRALPLDVPRTDSGFAASDLVLGRDGSGLVLRRPGGDIPLAPLGRFPREGAVELYYELYGLPRGTPVDTRVSVTPAAGRSLFQRIFGGGRGVHFAYTTVTDSARRAQVRQKIVLRGLHPGRYRLTVTFRDPGTRRLVRRQDEFVITGARAS